MKPDQASLIKVLPSHDPVAIYNSNGTLTGAIIDTKGYGSLTFTTQTGVLTDSNLVQVIYGGNASNMSDEVAVVAPNLIGAEPTFALTDDSTIKRVGVLIENAGFRYYRLKITQAAATTGGFFCAQAILGSPSVAPVALP